MFSDVLECSDAFKNVFIGSDELGRIPVGFKAFCEILRVVLMGFEQF